MADCHFPILTEMNTCGGQDDALEVTIETYQNRLYRYRIVEERTRAIVHGELLKTCLQHE